MRMIENKRKSPKLGEKQRRKKKRANDFSRESTIIIIGVRDDDHSLRRCIHRDRERERRGEYEGDPRRPPPLRPVERLRERE